jgi:hypothetical protein
MGNRRTPAPDHRARCVAAALVAGLTVDAQAAWRAHLRPVPVPRPRPGRYPSGRRGGRHGGGKASLPVMAAGKCPAILLARRTDCGDHAHSVPKAGLAYPGDW